MTRKLIAAAALCLLATSLSGCIIYADSSSSRANLNLSSAPENVTAKPAEAR